MAVSKDFRDVRAWQLAHQMDLRVTLFLCSPEFRRQFKNCEQLRDAAHSGPRSIARGHERLRPKEFADFVRVARGSEEQVLKHLIDAHGQTLITTDELVINRRLARRAMRAANRLIRYLEAAE